MNFLKLRVPAGKFVELKDYSPSYTKPFANKDEADEKLDRDISKLSELQSKLHAQDTYALLIVLQGMDAAGKDSTIKHVMSGVNPTGCEVTSFKAPSDEELQHDYLWRHVRALPERGKIGIFNRSYYEEVLVTRVHSELMTKERIPHCKKDQDLWNERFREIKRFEHYLIANGIHVLKFFLNLSKEEQKKRFLARLDMAEKNWKFSEADVAERTFWNDYQHAYQEMLSNTSTKRAPWHVIPADHKWFTHVAVADIIVRKLASLDLEYPRMTSQQTEALQRARHILESEK